jgi:hypothetical protein
MLGSLCTFFFCISTQHRLQTWRVGFCICRACIHLVQSLNTSAVYGPTVPFRHYHRTDCSSCVQHFISFGILSYDKKKLHPYRERTQTERVSLRFSLIFLSFYLFTLFTSYRTARRHVDTCGLWFYCFIRLVPNGKTNYILMKT